MSSKGVSFAEVQVGLKYSWAQVGMWPDESSSFSGDFIMSRCSDKSYLVQGFSESYMCKHLLIQRTIKNSVKMAYGFVMIN